MQLRSSGYAKLLLAVGSLGGLMGVLGIPRKDPASSSTELNQSDQPSRRITTLANNNPFFTLMRETVYFVVYPTVHRIHSFIGCGAFLTAQLRPPSKSDPAIINVLLPSTFRFGLRVLPGPFPQSPQLACENQPFVEFRRHGAWLPEARRLGASAGREAIKMTMAFSGGSKNYSARACFYRPETRLLKLFRVLRDPKGCVLSTA
ncbi:hypothetical protein BT67DRAFT_258612 [Trichocladium antarcticum]|uniref:Uncharacterized protein n=1 Tax=Trichocladium antarcticum TaxID=1450529 RepID=A0AAN6ZFM0_9PEZI|nr:hypothetical protein BT67DRAFT_258612 [Trichocladium antarcticum]